MKTTVYTKDGQEFSIEIPQPGNSPSFFVFALHKSGSVMQDKIITEICACVGIPAISVSVAAFNQGIREEFLTRDICQIFAKNGYCFYGFRTLPFYFDGFDFTKFKKILLIRDPRDILVSHYFSIQKSHGLPPGELGEALLKKRHKLMAMDINDYALEQAPMFQKIIQRYTMIEDEKFKLFRYEDVIFNKQQWVSEILRFLNFEIEESQAYEIAKKQDIFPQEENEKSHIRKVTPGDHQEKLKTSTIKSLNETFEDILLKYNYGF
jgi:Sulfotransferase domain